MELADTVLNAADVKERADAAEQLARLGADARVAAVALVRASGDREASVRDWAVAALEELGPPRESDIKPLAALVQNPDTNIAYWACTLLGRLQTAAEPAVPQLIEALSKHDDLAVRQRAAWALGQIGTAAKTARLALEKAAQSGDARLTRLAQAALAAIAGK